jgi:hypothetical protein
MSAALEASAPDSRGHPSEVARVLRPYSPELGRALRKRADQTLEALKGARVQEFQHWKEISEWIEPRRGQWLLTHVKDRGKLHGRIVNNRAGWAGKVAAAGLQSGMTSRARPWFRLTTADPRLRESRAVKAWLQNQVDLLREIFERSNFYEVVRTNYSELVHWGTAAFSIWPDYRNVIHCRQHTIGSYYLGVDHKGLPDTFAEEFVLTVGQMVDRYQFDRLAEPVQQAAKQGKLDRTRVIRRIVQPNRERRQAGFGWRRAPFMLMEYDHGDPTGELLSLAPEHEFPFIVPRWDTLPDYAYAASCPGMDALADQKELQAEMINWAAAREQIGNPTTVLPPSLRNSIGPRIKPGQQIFTSELDGQKGVRRAFEPTNQIAELRESILSIQDRIDRAYHVDVFQAITRIDGGNMRVVEIDARVREQMSQLGPIVEATAEQQNDPAILRTFAIAERAGLIEPPPKELEGHPVKIEYVSILAQAQKAADIDVLDRWFIAGQSMKAVDVEGGFVFNGREWMKAYADKLGVPTPTVRGDREVAALTQQANQQAQMAQAAEMAQMGARAAKDASGASLEGENVLTAARDAYAQQGAG